MSDLKIPADAEFGFRLTVSPSFMAPFRTKAWGSGKWGWFSTTCKNAPRHHDIVISRQRMRKGEWRELVNYAEQGRLFDLPETLRPSDNWSMQDGSRLVFEIQSNDRYHVLHRANDMEPQIARVINHLLTISTAEYECHPYYYQKVEEFPPKMNPPYYDE